MKIRRLHSADATAFQVLRLAALLDTPEAFEASHEEEVDMPRWRSPARRRPSPRSR